LHSVEDVSVEQHLVTWGDGDRDKALLDESMQVRESGDGMVECEGPAQLPHGNSWFQLVSVADRSLRFPPAVLPCGLCVAQFRTLPPAREAIRRCNANAAVLLQPPRSRAVAWKPPGDRQMGAAGGFQVPCRRAWLVRLILGEVPCVWRPMAFLGELCAG
jgi:hypothetical protein